MTYLSTVLADAPRNYWRLADGCSVILHDIGSDPKQLLVATSPLNGGYTGIEALAGSTYGNNLGGTLGTTVNTTSPITLEVWVWMGWFNALEEAVFMADNGAGAGSYSLWILNNGKAFFRGSGVGVTGLAALSLNVWHHLVGTFDEANVKLYVDGVLQGSAANAGHVVGAKQVWLGAMSSAATEPCHAFLAEAAIYGTALSAARVAAHYAAAGPLNVPVGGLAAMNSTINVAQTAAVGNADLSKILNAVQKVY